MTGSSRTGSTKELPAGFGKPPTHATKFSNPISPAGNMISGECPRLNYGTPNLNNTGTNLKHRKDCKMNNEYVKQEWVCEWEYRYQGEPYRHGKETFNNAWDATTLKVELERQKKVTRYDFFDLPVNYSDISVHVHVYETHGFAAKPLTMEFLRSKCPQMS